MLARSIALSVLVLACADAGGQPSVELVDVTFRPPELRVKVGSDVRYGNRDAASHTVTQGRDGVAAGGAAFDQPLPPGAVISIRFPTIGRFSVTCLLHPTMNQVVDVVP